MLNKCEFIGRLGQDVVVNYTASGSACANISLGVNESWTDKNTNQKQEKTEWIRVSIFGKTAEICSQYLNKGSKVYVCGKFTTRKWTDKQGNDKFSSEIVVDGFNGSQVIFLDPKHSDKQEVNSGKGFQNKPQQQAQNNPPMDNFDDDIPF